MTTAVPAAVETIPTRAEIIRAAAQAAVAGITPIRAMTTMAKSRVVAVETPAEEITAEVIQTQVAEITAVAAQTLTAETARAMR